MRTARRRTSMHRRSRTPAAHRSRATAGQATVALVLGWLAACAPATTPPSETAVQPLAERHTWGGLCPEGPCHSTLTVSADGGWTWSDEATETQGLVSPREVDRLREAILSSALPPTGVAGTATARERPGSETVACEADADGRSVRYGWESHGQGWLTVDSCEQPLDPRDPLVVHLEELAQRLAP